MKSVFVAVLFLLLSAVVRGQDYAEIGIKPSGSYFNGSIDSVDLFTGNVSGAIPIVSFSQLGQLPPLSFSLNFNTAPYVQQEYCDSSYSEFCDLTYYTSTNANFSPQFSSTSDAVFLRSFYLQNSLSDYYITHTDPSGYTRDFLPTGNSPAECSTSPTSVPLYLYAMDGSGYTLVGACDATIYSTFYPVTLYAPTGVSTTTSYTPPTTCIPYGPQGMCEPYKSNTTTKDTNGNTIQHQSAPAQYVDSIGRVIPDVNGLMSAITGTDNASYQLLGNLSPDISECPNLQVANQVPASSYKWIVPGPAESSMTYLICLLYTAFDSGGNAILSDGGIGQIQSVSLPNKAYWGFVYDGPFPSYDLLGQFCVDNTLGGPPSPAPCGPQPGSAANIIEIRYPTGGKVHYWYTNISRWPDWGDPSSYYAVSQRTEYDVDGNARTTHYSYNSLSSTQFATTVTDALGNDTVHTFTDLANTHQAYETGVQVYQGSSTTGSLLKSSTTQYLWKPDYAYIQAFDTTQCFYAYEGICRSYGIIDLQQASKIANVVPLSVATSLPSGLTTTVSYGYNTATSGDALSPFSLPLFNHPDISSTVDSLGNSRTNLISRLNLSSFSYGSPSLAMPNATNQLELPSQLIALDSATSSAHVLSATNFNYDENNGSPQGTLGSQTSVSRWLNLSTSPMSYAEYSADAIYGNPVNNIQISSTIYSNQGMPVSVTDGNGVTTTVQTSECGGLFASSEVVGQSFGAYYAPDTYAAPETFQQSHDCTTGQLKSRTDPNGVVTNYSYTDRHGDPDPLGRLRQVKSAVGTGVERWLTIDYRDMNHVSVARDKNSKGDGLIKSSEIYNGLAQVTHKWRPNGSRVDIAYNLNGQVSSVSNPYFSMTDSTYGSTSYQYDALGRTVIQTQPGSTGSLQWCYDNIATNGQTNCRSNVSGSVGEWVDRSDESQNDLQQVSDGLGQLRSVVEPGPTGGLVTNYGYDGLGNLLSVEQRGMGSTADVPRLRSYSYDTWSRLFQAYNPESGWICYGLTSGTAVPGRNAIPSGSNCTIGSGYDNNGNLLFKTDMRGTTNKYSYDNFNRLVEKAVVSSDPNPVVPFSVYYYDSATLGKGRLAFEATGLSGGVNIPTLEQSTTNIIAYDALGRVISAKQCVFSNTVCSAGAGVGDSIYSYDLADNLTSYQGGVSNIPGVGSVTFSNTYDAASQLRAVTSSWNDLVHPSSLFTGTSYNAAGALTSGSSGSGLSTTRTFDSRLRITGEQDTGSIVQTLAMPATGTITITGSELTK